MKLINQKINSADEYAPQFASGTPFMIEGCIVLQCIKGKASFMLDFKRFEISESDVVFLFNDMLLELGQRSEDFAVRYVSISAERVLEIYLTITSQKFWDTLYLSPLQKLSEKYSDPFDCWMKQCIFVSDVCESITADAILTRQVISLFEVMVDIVNKNEPDVTYMPNSSPWNIVGDFLVLLSRHYTAQHKVAFYAESLNITPDYLSRVVKEYFGVTPKEAIERKIVLAMKALLDNTPLSIKSIADRLNYDDSSHLCKVFRRQAGLSPMQYRNRQTKDFNNYR